LPLVSDVYGLARFATSLKAFLADPLSVEGAKDSIRKRIALRDRAFLETVEHAVFANPTSPHRKLFRLAGCELRDVAELVRREGLEQALRELTRAGVFTTFEEFKGQARQSACRSKSR
jgi:hypothetical protein